MVASRNVRLADNFFQILKSRPHSNLFLNTLSFQDIATVRIALVRQAEVFAQFSVFTQLSQHEVGHI